MIEKDLPLHIWVRAMHYVAARLVLAAPEYSQADRDKASIVATFTSEKLSLEGYAPEAGCWLLPESLAAWTGGGPVFGIPMADGEQVVHVPGDSYRKAIQLAYSCPLMSDPAKTIT